MRWTVVSVALVIIGAGPDDNRRAIFDAEADSMMPTVTQAEQVVTCGIKTEDWAVDVMLGITKDPAVAAVRLWPDGQEAARNSVLGPLTGRLIAAKTRGKQVDPAFCASMVGSPVVEALDGIAQIGK